MNSKMDFSRWEGVSAPVQRQPRVVALWPGDDTQPGRPVVIFKDRVSPKMMQKFRIHELNSDKFLVVFLDFLLEGNWPGNGKSAIHYLLMFLHAKLGVLTCWISKGEIEVKRREMSIFSKMHQGCWCFPFCSPNVEGEWVLVVLLGPSKPLQSLQIAWQVSISCSTIPDDLPLKTLSSRGLNNPTSDPRHIEHSNILGGPSYQRTPLTPFRTGVLRYIQLFQDFPEWQSF